MSSFKRGNFDWPPSPVQVRSAKRSSLFLNSVDKSSSPVVAEPPPAPKSRSDILVAAVRQWAHRDLDAADATGCGRMRGRGNKRLVAADRIAQCALAQTIPYRCKNGHRWEVQPLGCGVRLCPRCERRAAFHVEERLAFLLARFQNPVRMLTLTLRNHAVGRLEEMLQELDRAFRRLRGSKAWKRYVRGAVAVFECTVSEERGWHAHIHVAFDGSFMPHAEIRAAWIKATRGEGQQVNLRGQRWPKAAACRYLSKYSAKGVKLGDLPEELVCEFVQAWWKFRTLRTYGTMYRIKYEKAPWDGVHRCPECGEEGEPVVAVFTWSRSPPGQAVG